MPIMNERRKRNTGKPYLIAGVTYNQTDNKQHASSIQTTSVRRETWIMRISKRSRPICRIGGLFMVPITGKSGISRPVSRKTPRSGRRPRITSISTSTSTSTSRWWVWTWAWAWAWVALIWIRTASASASASAAPLSTAQKSNRRISLIERSKMAASHSAASHSAASTTTGSSRTVTGVARLTNRRTSTGTRRFSLVRSRVPTGLTDSKEKKRGEEGEEKERAEEGKSVKRNNSAAEQTEKIVISPTKRRRYTVSVNRNSQPSYTFTPSTDRRKTLDSLLMKATKLNESDSTLNNTSELCSVFLFSTMFSYLFDLDILSQTW